MKSVKRSVGAGSFRIALISVASALAVSTAAYLAVLLARGGAPGAEFIAVPVLTFAAAAAGAYFASRRAGEKLSDDIKSTGLKNAKEEECYAELLPLLHQMDEQSAYLDKKLTEMREEHRKQDEQRREFTANVSHELKTPLTSISGYAELIKEGIAKEEDIKRFAGKICDESSRLITLTGDIIKLSQLDGREINAVPEDVDLYELCEGILSHLEMAAKKKGVSMALTGEHIVIHAAEQVIEELIFNICDNAIKYNVPDGRVDIAIRRCVDGVEVSVKDTGIGIPKEDIPHVFERFYRVDKSHSKEIGGTGLGLSIVKHCAMFLGARVSLESEPGKGSCFKILF